MKKKVMFILAVFAIALVLLLLISKLSMGTLFGAVITAIVAGLLLENYFSKKEKADAPEKRPEPKPNKTEQQLNALVQLNLKLRKDPDRDDDLLSSIEKIIDTLNSVLPRLNEDHPSSDLTYQMGRVVDEYLLTAINNFLRLSVDSRNAKKAELIKSLNSLEERLADILKRIDSLAESDFEVDSEMLKSFVEN